MAVTLPASSNSGKVLIQLGYSAGNLGKSIILSVLDTFLLYYLVRVAGFPPLQAGALLTAAMLWDGIADVTVAYLADRYGRADALARLIFVGAVPCAGGFWMIFAWPPTGGGPVIAAAVMLCRTGFTLCDIGHNTLLVHIATTPQQAATVSGMRLLFSAMGAGLVGLTTAAILSAPASAQPGMSGQAAMIGGGIYVVTLLIAVAATRGLPVPGPYGRPARLMPMIAGLARNRAYRDMLCLIALQAGLVPLFGRALPFVGEARHGGADWAGTALAIITLCQAASLPMWMAASRWQSPIRMIAVAYAVMLAALGLLAAGPDGAGGPAGLVLIGIAQAGMNMAIWALLALAVRRGAAAGAMGEAFPVGMFLAVLKGSAGIGNGLLTLSIAFGTRAVGHVTHVATLLPALGCLAALAFVVRSRFRGGASAR